MKKELWVYISVVVVLIVAFVGNAYVKTVFTTERVSVHFDRIPFTLGQWQGSDLPVEERVYEILETRQLITREYKDANGKNIWLYVIYAGDNRSSFHPPELCRSGNNYELVKKELLTLQSQQGLVQVNSLIFEYDKKHVELNLNWFTAGQRVCANYYKQQVYIILDQLIKHNGTGSMVQVSTTLYPDEKNEDAQERLVEFSQLLLEPLNSIFK